MATIKFKYGDVNYTLCYTKDSIAALENAGVDIDDLQSGVKPVNSLVYMFRFAFREHHPDTPVDLIEEIRAGIENKNELYAALAEMIAEQVRGMIENPKENEKKVTWAVSK